MKRVVCICECVFILSLGFLASCGEEPTDAVTNASGYQSNKALTLPPAGDDYEVVGVKEGLMGYMIKYDDKIYRGGEMANQKGLDFLKTLGVTTVVTITPTDDERKYVVEEGMKLIEVPFFKTDGPSAEVMKTFLDAVKSSPGPVYVHCHGGTHRAAILACLYRMAVLDWDFNRTAVEFGTLGGDLKGDHGMLVRMGDYAKSLKGGL